MRTLGNSPTLDIQQASNGLPSRDQRRWWLVLAAAYLVCALYGHWTLTHGWIPHDAGTLGQSAERVLRGQLPHRDYDELYTGGLSLLYGAAFAVWRPSIYLMRAVLYVFFLAWIPAVYYIARIRAPREIALCATLLCVTWSIPVYPEAIPSWYNLYFATFGVAALLRFLDTDHTRWLFIAGLCAGSSCLTKITGLYFVAAAGLFLLYCEQDRARSGTGVHGRTYSVAMTALLLVFLSFIAMLGARFPAAPVVALVLAPALLVATIVGIREWRSQFTSSLSRFRTLARWAIPFLLGCLAPLACFLVPYVATHSLSALWRGLVIVPSRLIVAARLAPTGLLEVSLTLGLALAAGRWWRSGGSGWRGPLAITFGLFMLVAALAGRATVAYRFMWVGMEALIPLLSAFAIWSLLVRQDRTSQDQRRQFLLVAAVGVCGLIRFPFAAHVYFFYVAPLAVLAAVSLLDTLEQPQRSLSVVLMGAYTLFSVLAIDSTQLYALGHEFVQDGYTSPLALERAGIRTTRSDSVQYEQLVRVLRAHAVSEYTYVSPDSPEVYFLSGLKNPTRTVSELYDDPAGRTERILRVLLLQHVSVIALNQHPAIGPGLPLELDRALAARYPSSTRIGNFIVRWQQASDSRPGLARD